MLVNTPDRSINILKAEMPGPTVDKLVPKSKDTARTLYIIYTALTALEVIFLLLGGMSLFDSVVHALSTAGTGEHGTMTSEDGIQCQRRQLQPLYPVGADGVHVPLCH